MLDDRPGRVLAVLAVVGGWIADPGALGAVSGLARRTIAEPLVEPTVPQDYADERASPSSLGLARDRRSPGCLLRAPARASCRVRPLPATSLEHKLYFDELYDALFYRPAVWLAGFLRRWSRSR